MGIKGWIALTCTALLLAGCGSVPASKPNSGQQTPSKPTATKVRQLTIVHALKKDSGYQVGAIKWAELIKGYSNGTIEFNITPEHEIYERDVALEVIEHKWDAAVITSSQLTSFLQDLEVFDLPYLFKDKNHVYRVLDGEIGQAVLKQAESKADFVALTYMENGMRNFTNSVRPIKNPEDLAGLRLRTMNNSVHMQMVEMLEARPIPLPFNDLYTKLQTKEVDGQENPLNIIVSGNLEDVQKYLSLTGHVYASAILIVNKKLWASLSPEEKTIFEKAAKEATLYQRKWVSEKEQGYLDMMRSKGVIVEEHPDILGFQKKLEPLYAKLRQQYPAQLIDQIRRT